MFNTLTNTAFIGAMLFGTSAQANTAEEQLTLLDRAMQQAVVDRDPVAFGSYLTDDYVLVVSSSSMYGKSEVVADITAPNTKFSLNESSNLNIRVHGDTAMVIADLHQVFTRDGKPFDYWVRFTDTWIMQNGRWLCLSGHATLLQKK
ncbi:MAG: nuclear transport factor 2 family protein [Arenimonas sp.]